MPSKPVYYLYTKMRITEGMWCAPPRVSLARVFLSTSELFRRARKCLDYSLRLSRLPGRESTYSSLSNRETLSERTKSLFIACGGGTTMHISFHYYWHGLKNFLMLQYQNSTQKIHRQKRMRQQRASQTRISGKHAYLGI